MTNASDDSRAPILSTRQLDVPDYPRDVPYLGDADTVHEVVGKFADAVLKTYGEFLGGKQKAIPAQLRIDDLINEYADIFMGRNPSYAIAPWQGERMRGTLLGAIESMKYADDPGHALFTELALQVVRAAVALHKGESDKEVGEMLKEILDSYRGLILGVNL